MNILLDEKNNWKNLYKNSLMEKLAIINYKKIYSDILKKKCPEKIPNCYQLLKKERLSFLDVIELNRIIFDKFDREMEISNQKHRFYDKFSILEILEYQKKNNLNNTQLANHFKLSRNSIAKWKKIFFLLTLFISLPFYTQIGINTKDPKATLHIANNSKISFQGIIIPNVSALEASQMVLTIDQYSRLVYIKDGADTTMLQTEKMKNVFYPGFYYFNNRNPDTSVYSFNTNKIWDAVWISFN